MVAFLLWLIVYMGSVYIMRNFIAPAGRRERNTLIRAIYLIFIAIWWIAAIGSPLYFEYPNYGISRVITFDGNRAVERPFGAFAWEFSRNFSHVPAGETTLSYTSPHTKNRYAINTVIYDPDSFFEATERRHSRNADVANEINMITTYGLLECDTTFGQLLSPINPADKEDQLALATFVEVCLNAKIARYGIMVTTVDLQ